MTKRRTSVKRTLARRNWATRGAARMFGLRIADRIYRHPGGTLPAKLHEPKDYKAMDRLMNRPEATHAAMLGAAPPANAGS